MSKEYFAFIYRFPEFSILGSVRGFLLVRFHILYLSLCVLKFTN